MKLLDKKILAGALLVGVAGVWVPQLLSAGSDARSIAPLEMPADASGGSSGVLGLFSAGGEDAAGTTTEGTPDGTKDGEVPGSGATRVVETIGVDAALARAQRLLTDRDSIDVPNTDVPTPPVPSESTGGGANAGGEPTTLLAAGSYPTEGPIDPHTSLDGPRTGFEDPLETFLAAHPLQATVIGASERVATLGPRLVRVGDEVAPGIVVAAIEARHVVLRRGGQDVRVDLAPFRARAPVTTGGAGGAGRGTNSSDDDAGGGASASPTSTGPSGPSAGTVSGATVSPAPKSNAGTSTGTNTSTNPSTGTGTNAGAGTNGGSSASAKSGTSTAGTNTSGGGATGASAPNTLPTKTEHGGS